MTGDFNIKNNNWDPLYPYHSIHTDTLREIADSFNLELSMPINQIPTRYADNMTESNSVINLILLWNNSEEINTHTNLLDLRSLSDHTYLMVNIIIREEFIQGK